MAFPDIRRLAAIDMWGSSGTTRRRRIILAELLLGALGGTAIGLVSLSAAESPPWAAFSLYVVGIGLNYVPLAWHAVRFSRSGALERELAGVDVGPELRSYTVRQLWVFVPLLFVVLELFQQGRRSAA